jgi:hypothetical protein
MRVPRTTGRPLQISGSSVMRSGMGGTWHGLRENQGTKLGRGAIVRGRAHFGGRGWELGGTRRRRPTGADSERVGAGRFIRRGSPGHDTASFSGERGRFGSVLTGSRFEKVVRRIFNLKVVPGNTMVMPGFTG